MRLHTILYAALRSRLAHQIQKALHTDTNITRGRFGRQFIAEPTVENELRHQDLEEQLLPLKQVRQSKGQQIQYGSAVALKYAHRFEVSALKFAENLLGELDKIEIKANPEASSLNPLHHDIPLDHIQQYFHREVTPSGWIHFRLAPSGLKIWLQFLIHSPLPVAKDTSTAPLEYPFFTKKAAYARNSTSVFPILHTYARCHSLLRLGQQLGLIQSGRSNPTAINEVATEDWWQIQTPSSFPWLLPSGEFRGHHPTVWQLIEELCAALDETVQLDAALDGRAVAKRADRNQTESL